MSSTPHIAIVGAGLAGLSCATALQQAGLRVSVFDKSRGPSGRMSNRRGEGWSCDHGAQYFTARDPAFRAEVARWEAAGAAALWTPRLQVIGGGGGHDLDPAVARFVGVPRMTSPAAFLAQALTVALDTTVSAVAQEDGRWALSTLIGGPQPPCYDAVVLAVPAPQAVPLLARPAPHLAALAASVTMRGCWAMMARFEQALPWPFDAAFVNEGPLRWMCRDSSKPGRTGPETWLLHASADWSEAHLDDEPDVAAQALLTAFEACGGPRPQAWTVHRWRYADALSPLQAGCAWDSALRLGVCGDWLQGGKVEGAWLSGQAAARQVRSALTA